jgi:ribosomal protein S18 acetylase RimI-like enzyme
MATAPVSNPEIRIIPLADADVVSLERLFDDECDEWLEVLKWDYRPASMLIRDVARQQQLAGVAAIAGNKVIGFAYYVVEGNRSSIGDIYVARQWRDSGVDGDIAVATLDRLSRTRRLRRIESQYVGLDNRRADRVFQEHGFERLERNYMLADLASAAPMHTSALADISIRTWQQTDFEQAARVIHRSYRGKDDSRINSQYRSLQGCADLLTILTDHFWCGEFLPDVSMVAVRPSGALGGALIASRVSSGVGHLSQISVHPGHQGRGIGRRMIEQAISKFRDLNYRAVTLAVTTSNTNALRLYESCGFRTIHTFPVFYRDRG